MPYVPVSAYVFRFLSTVEARRYPIYGVQYHPEAVQFDWTKNARFINRSVPSIAIAQYLANFFVGECRKYVALSRVHCTSYVVFGSIPQGSILLCMCPNSSSVKVCQCRRRASYWGLPRLEYVHVLSL